MDLRQLWNELKLNNPQLTALRESYLSAKAVAPQIAAPANPQSQLLSHFSFLVKKVLLQKLQTLQRSRYSLKVNRTTFSLALSFLLSITTLYQLKSSCRCLKKW
jgi:hypothetical protein